MRFFRFKYCDDKLLAKTPDGAANVGGSTITMVSATVKIRMTVVSIVRFGFSRPLATSTPNLVGNEALATGRMNSISLFGFFGSRALAKAQTLRASLSVGSGTAGMSSNTRSSKVWAVSVVESIGMSIVAIKRFGIGLS